MPSSVFERRLAAEWQLLLSLLACNGDRLTDPCAHGSAMSLTLRKTPALLVREDGAEVIETEHRVHVEFPRFFPAVPMELTLKQPVQHPNIHPETGFVCLWERHRVSNTIEHAILKTAEMFSWRLSNQSAEHIMQPAVLLRLRAQDHSLLQRLYAPPLNSAGQHEPAPMPPGPRRRRLL